MSFGYVLSKFREERGLSLREFSKLCEFDHTYIYRLEKDEKTAPSKDVVDAIVRTLKLSGRRERLLRLLVGKTVNQQLIDVFIEDEDRSLELLEPLASISFRGNVPRLTTTGEDKLNGSTTFWISKTTDMEELSVILKAREFIAGIDTVPVNIKQLAAAANATIKVSGDLDDDESGQTFSIGGKNFITVNGNHREERQRFTALHEIAHIILELPSQHHGTNGTSMTISDLISYRRRPKEEILCDVFAAECLLPYKLFSRDIEDMDVSLESVKDLAMKYKASMTATGSRFAVNCDLPCAFVLVEDGKIRYVSSSKFLRERKGWIDIGVPVPRGSVAYRLLHSSSKNSDYDELDTGIWFNNGVRGFHLLSEEAILYEEWKQCLSLIWFDDDLGPAGPDNVQDSDDGEPLLEELDGILPWPSKRKRK